MVFDFISSVDVEERMDGPNGVPSLDTQPRQAVQVFETVESPNRPIQQVRCQLDPAFSRVAEPEGETEEKEDEDDSVEDELEGPPQSPEIGVPTQGACERIFKENNNSILHMLVMAIGIKHPDSGRVIAQCEDDPLYKTHNKQHVPRGPLMKTEGLRRWVAKGGKNNKDLTRPKKSASKKECIQCLLDNPVDDPQDVSFLLSEEGKHCALLLQVEREAKEMEQEKLQTSNWTGDFPWLRFYCCLVDDPARRALLFKGEVLDRPELDARNNTDMRPAACEEVVACLFNDQEKIYVTDALPDLHSPFAEPISLPFALMPGGTITAEDVKKKLADARAKLIQIISNWEASGNGFGQRSRDDQAFGHCEEHVQENGDNRANFVQTHKGHKFHHLHLWCLSDKMGVLNNVLNVLSPEAAADGDNPPRNTQETQRPSKRGRDEEDEEEKDKRDTFRTRVGASMLSIAITSEEDSLMKLEEKLTEHQEKWLSTDENDKAKRQFYRNKAVRMSTEVRDTECEIECVKAEARGEEPPQRDDEQHEEEEKSGGDEE